MIRHPSSKTSRLGIRGLTGRDPLADGLSRRLDDGWHWFRDIGPGGIAPIDAVVVGPGGTWAVSRTGERGRFTRRNGHWYRWNRSTESWVPWDATAITAARLAARRLSLYLERAGLPAEVCGAMVPPADMSIEAAPGGTIGVAVAWEPDRLAVTMAADERLTPGQVDRIVALLDPRQPLPQLAPSTPPG
jgi:hypothetical protein